MAFFDENTVKQFIVFVLPCPRIVAIEAAVVVMQGYAVARLCCDKTSVTSARSSMCFARFHGVAVITFR